jgi:hypothetical protein
MNRLRVGTNNGRRKGICCDGGPGVWRAVEASRTPHHARAFSLVFFSSVAGSRYHRLLLSFVCPTCGLSSSSVESTHYRKCNSSGRGRKQPSTFRTFHYGRVPLFVSPWQRACGVIADYRWLVQCVKRWQHTKDIHGT